MKRSTIHFFQAASALGAMGYGVMFTVLDDYRDRYGIAESKLGLIVGIGFITGFVSQVLLAPQADRGHAKRMVMAGLMLGIAGNIMMAVGHSFPPLLIGRLLTGLGVGMCDPALKRIIIVAEPERMGHNLGLLVSAGVGGFTAGPIVSALTADHFGLAVPFLLVASLVAVVLLVIMRTHVDESRDEAAPTQKLAFDLLRIRPLSGAIVIGLALFVMIGTFDSLWSVMMDDMSAPTWVASLGISLFALPMIFIAPRGGRLTQSVGPFRASIAGLSLGAVFLTLYGTLPSPYLMLFVGVSHGIVDGLTVTGGSAAVALVAPRDRLAAAQGLYGGLQTLTGGVAAVAAGASYGVIGRSTFIACSVLMILLIVTGSLMAHESLDMRGSNETDNSVA